MKTAKPSSVSPCLRGTFKQGRTGKKRSRGPVIALFTSPRPVTDLRD